MKWQILSGTLSPCPFTLGFCEHYEDCENAGIRNQTQHLLGDVLRAPSKSIPGALTFCAQTVVFVLQILKNCSISISKYPKLMPGNT